MGQALTSNRFHYIKRSNFNRKGEVLAHHANSLPRSSTYRGRIETEEKARSLLLVGGRIGECCTNHLATMRI